VRPGLGYGLRIRCGLERLTANEISASTASCGISAEYLVGPVANEPEISRTRRAYPWRAIRNVEALRRVSTRGLAEVALR
jgi:hypothetical protein